MFHAFMAFLFALIGAVFSAAVELGAPNAPIHSGIIVVLLVVVMPLLMWADSYISRH